MTYDTVMFCAGLTAAAVALIQHFALAEKRMRLDAEEAEAVAVAATKIVGSINYRTGEWVRPNPDEDYIVQHISKGRDSYGAVLESVRVSMGQRVPTMPRPAPEGRCQWCRVQLTHGKCVNGCGGHQ